MENTNNKDIQREQIQFIEDRIEKENLNILPILEYIVGNMRVGELRKELMDLYVGLSEFILWREEEYKEYPYGLSFPLSLVRQFCDALEEAQTTSPTVTIKRLKP